MQDLDVAELLRQVVEQGEVLGWIDDEAVTDEDQTVTIEVLDNDSDGNNDQLEIESFTQAGNGNAFPLLARCSRIRRC